MMKRLFFIFGLVFFIMLAANVKAACVVPTDDLLVNNDTILCKNNYAINDVAGDGVIIMNGDFITLDCNGSVIKDITSDGKGISVNAVRFGTVKNCIIAGYKGGIVDDSTGYNTTYFNNSFDGNMYSMYIDSSYNNITQNSFYGSNIIDLRFDAAVTRNKIYANSFQAKGVEDNAPNLNNYCVNYIGNTYNPVIPPANRGWNECNMEIVTPQAGDIYTTDFLINWTKDNPAGIDYQVQYSPNGGATWSNLGSTTGTTMIFPYAGKPVSNNYIIKVTSLVTGTVATSGNFTLAAQSMVTGTVFDCDGHRMNSAKVSIDDPTYNTSVQWTFSNINGDYTLTKIPHGTYSIVASNPGYENDRHPITVPPASTVERNFTICKIASLCTPDCTIQGSNICDSSCHMINGCVIEPKCNGKTINSLLYNSHNQSTWYRCCRLGEFQEKESKILLKIESENIATTTSIVTFVDDLKKILGAKMKVVVFEKKATK